MITPSLDIFQAIADPSRRRILQMLSEDSLTINTIAEQFDMSRPAVSKHIKVLYDTNFIAIQNIGRERYCTLNREGFSGLQEWISYFDRFWVSKLDTLTVLLNNRSQDGKGK